MIVKVTRDIALIKSIVFHPAIFAHISEDGASQPEELPDAIYLAGIDNAGVVVGIFVCIPVSRHVMDVHIHVLPEHRKESAMHFAKACFDWIWDSTPTVKICAQVPTCCENVFNFAKKAGFDVEGVNRRSWKKSGIFFDSWYLGLLRGE